MCNASTTLEGKMILVTGAAGFIGYFLTKRLLELGCSVVGLDSGKWLHPKVIAYSRD